jgi:hypothetical protein
MKLNIHTVEDLKHFLKFSKVLSKHISEDGLFNLDAEIDNCLKFDWRNPDLTNDFIEQANKFGLIDLKITTDKGNSFFYAPINGKQESLPGNPITKLNFKVRISTPLFTELNKLLLS